MSKRQYQPAERMRHNLTPKVVDFRTNETASLTSRARKSYVGFDEKAISLYRKAFEYVFSEEGYNQTQEIVEFVERAFPEADVNFSRMGFYSNVSPNLLPTKGFAEGMSEEEIGSAILAARRILEGLGLSGLRQLESKKLEAFILCSVALQTISSFRPIVFDDINSMTFSDSCAAQEYVFVMAESFESDEFIPQPKEGYFKATDIKNSASIVLSKKMRTWFGFSNAPCFLRPLFRPNSFAPLFDKLESEGITKDLKAIVEIEAKMWDGAGELIDEETVRACALAFCEGMDWYVRCVRKMLNSSHKALEFFKQTELHNGAFVVAKSSTRHYLRKRIFGQIQQMPSFTFSSYWDFYFLSGMSGKHNYSLEAPACIDNPFWLSRTHKAINELMLDAFRCDARFHRVYNRSVPATISGKLRFLVEPLSNEDGTLPMNNNRFWANVNHVEAVDPTDILAAFTLRLFGEGEG